MSTRSQSNSKIRKRKLSRFFRQLRWLFILLLILILCLGLHLSWNYLKHWSFFQVTKIEVSGNQHSSPEEIILLSGIKPGMGIFDFQLKEVLEAVLSHPWVASAQVSRQLPDRVLITVKEHQPLAIVIISEPFYLNSDFRIFKRIIPGDSLDYPIFTGVSLEDLRDKNSSALKLLQGGILVWELTGRSKIFPKEQISEFHLEPGQGLIIITKKSQQIQLGEDKFEEKFRKLEQLCAELGKEFYWFKDLDLSRMDRVVVRLAKKTEPVDPGLEPKAETGAE